MIDTVAIVSGRSPDYLIDIVADGMIRFLGHEKVYIKYLGFNPETAEETAEEQYRHFYPVTKSHKNKISFYECQALIASTRVPIEYIKKYKQTTGGIVAIVDGEDWSELKNEHLKIADMYFKREYFRDERYRVKVLHLPRGRLLQKVQYRFVPCYYKRYPDKVFNLPFGMVPINYDSDDEHIEKTGNLFFAGTTKWAKQRLKLKDVVVSHGGTWMLNVLNMEDYAREVRRHWICLALRGGGWDTYRYWEIPYLGSAMLCQDHPLKIDDDFIHGESCLRFSTVDEAKSLIEEFLQKKERLAYIASKGKELVMKKHLSIHRAMKVWQTITSFAK